MKSAIDGGVSSRAATTLMSRISAKVILIGRSVIATRSRKRAASPVPILDRATDWVDTVGSRRFDMSPRERSNRSASNRDLRDLLHVR